jgi:co-chaperonin GroES (HSP10)
MTKAVAGLSAELENIGVDVRNDQEMDELDWTNDETKSLPKAGEVIVPFAWRILVMPMRPRSVTKGGILLPQTRQDTDQYLNYVGRVVALGPLAFRHSKYVNMGMKPEDIPQRGDWVIYPIYQYARIDFKGTKLILLNDDSFLARVPKGVSPWDFKLER